MIIQNGGFIASEFGKPEEKSITIFVVRSKLSNFSCSVLVLFLNTKVTWRCNRSGKCLEITLKKIKENFLSAIRKLISYLCSLCLFRKRAECWCSSVVSILWMWGCPETLRIIRTVIKCLQLNPRISQSFSPKEFTINQSIWSRATPFIYLIFLSVATRCFPFFLSL